MAETLGFHKAANRCHVSQPTLSAQVKQFEDVLDIQIFERDRRRVLLTEAGGVVVAHARRVLLEIDDMIAGARQLREPRSGTFRMLDEGDCFRAQALSVCNRAGARETELRATSLSTLAQMVSSGSGITLLPQIAVAVENRRCQLDVRPFTSPAPHRTIAPPVVCDCIPLIWRPQSPFADTFHELAQVFRAALGRDRSPGARRPVTR